MVYYFYAFIVVCCTSILQVVHATQIEGSRTSEVCIRLASHEDLNAVIALDRSISDEYFKPLLLQYPEYDADEVERILAEEIEKDIRWFPDCIAMKTDQRLYIAHVGTMLAGFVVCHTQDESIVVIDLLMIDAAYRGHGFGKRLIQAAVQAFPEASTSMLVVLDKNIQARAVYEKLGFSLMAEKPVFVQEKYSASRFLCYSMHIRQ